MDIIDAIRTRDALIDGGASPADCFEAANLVAILLKEDREQFSS